MNNYDANRPLVKILTTEGKFIVSNRRKLRRYMVNKAREIARDILCFENKHK